MRLLVAAGRHLDDVALIRRALDRMHALHPVEVVIHGGLPAVGPAVEEWARELRLHVVRYPANWREFGKRAEGIRNAFMLADSRPDVVLALPGGCDTRNLVLRALALGVTVRDVAGRVVGADAPVGPRMADGSAERRARASAYGRAFAPSPLPRTLAAE